MILKYILNKIKNIINFYIIIKIKFKWEINCNVVKYQTINIEKKIEITKSLIRNHKKLQKTLSSLNNYNKIYILKILHNKIKIQHMIKLEKIIFYM